MSTKHVRDITRHIKHDDLEKFLAKYYNVRDYQLQEFHDLCDQQTVVFNLLLRWFNVQHDFIQAKCDLFKSYQEAIRKEGLFQFHQYAHVLIKQDG